MELNIGPKQEGSVYKFLKNFVFIWFDPSVNNNENKNYQMRLKDLFYETNFVTKSSEVLPIIEKSTKLIIFYSCGGKYEEVKDTVEKMNNVVGICIFCGNREANLKHMLNCPQKVFGVASSFETLQMALRDKIYGSYMRFLRYYDIIEGRAFFTLAEKNIILKASTISYFNDKSSIFFPLGMGKMKLDAYLSEKNLKKIEEAVKIDKELIKYMDRKDSSSDHLAKIIEVTAFLRAKKSMEDIAKSFEMEDFSYMLNYYLRSQNPQKLEIFKEYMFCLKASLCKLCKPAIEKTIVYRGLGMSPDLYKEFEKNKGSCILLSGFTYACQNWKSAIEFAENNPHVCTTLLEIHLEECDKKFEDFMKEFGFPEENGVLFPIEIVQSPDSNLKGELILPPFYPVEIKDIKNEEKFHRIILRAPIFVNIAERDWTSKFYKEYSENLEWERSYTEQLSELAAKKAIDKISLVKMQILKKQEVFVEFLKKISTGQVLTQLTFGINSIITFALRI